MNPTPAATLSTPGTVVKGVGPAPGPCKNKRAK
jgi:hypothetical protein